MYVQAEGINQNVRPAQDRCVCKSNMHNIVFYEVPIVQTNETIAEYQDSRDTPEYGPFVTMESGRCSPQEDGEFPPECYMFNGEKGYPNLGPFVGGGKHNDSRAPYPDTHWLSFPDRCPTELWGPTKFGKCRQNTRRGLCPIGTAPDGVTCTFTYEILGWVPIDDLVGISNESYIGGKYENFTTWCKASDDHVEFAGDVKTGEMEKGLDFWKNPTDPEANKERAAKVIQLYDEIVSGKFVSSMIWSHQLKRFKPLPSPEELTAKNTKCYESVKCCAGGCVRTGYAQLCTPCKAGESGCEAADTSFSFPSLEKVKSEGEDQTPALSSAMSVQVTVASIALLATFATLVL
ncbi:hypothetical protein Poli38472_011735 [Pythium oligandrum]|uniref:Uncharacterized protein n=1 Tax=Pythium oligandrum TaxID=41045 RepID=A0A8K1C7T3_PYTOL|nr:hypothetical protein Poli38472_011735 [Pythium oligandrum]|eukprot:TMW58147.1 hypothetical protein Poli38472_011735 [Pythium oligandrum]